MAISRRKFIEYGLYLAGTAVLVDSLWAEQFFIEIKEFNFKNATPENYNLKILQLSDLHLKSVNYQLKKLAEKINSIKPDLIVITGDAIEESSKLTDLDEFLKLIAVDIKKVAILGNWEYWGEIDIDLLTKMYKSHNCDLLINQNKQYKVNGKKITITGLDDFIGNKADFKQSVINIKDSKFHLVLNHCPAYNDEIIKEANKSDLTVDLILSGHTHGGQINLLGNVLFLPEGSGEYVKGWYKKKGVSMYVSKGIGTSILPVRFGSRSEVAVFYV